LVEEIPYPPGAVYDRASLCEQHRKVPDRPPGNLQEQIDELHPLK